jgi:hypothetical protein
MTRGWPKSCRVSSVPARTPPWQWFAACLFFAAIVLALVIAALLQADAR